jgi:hypothetical protein
MLGVCLCGLAVATAGCGDSLTDQEFNPSQIVTETFGDTLTPGGGKTHVFVTLSAGTVTAVLTAVGDDNTRIIGVSLGNWSGTACNIAVANDNAITEVPIVAAVSAGGNLCARVYDSQGVPDATVYTLVVTHP